MSLRLKFILYLLFIHLAFAALAVYFLWNHRLWLLALEAFCVVSFVISFKLFRALLKPVELVVAGVETLKQRDFSSRLPAIHQPEIDQLIEVYNKMMDQLREERIRLQEQHFFLGKLLSASPAGIVTLDFDDRIATANRSAGGVLQCAPEFLLGKKLLDLHSPFAHALNRLQAGESQVLPLLGSRRVKCHKVQFLDQGFYRSFILMEELTEELRRSEKAAYEKLIRMMSHEVNNSIGAVHSLLHSCLHYKNQLRAEDRHDYENALQVAIGRTEHLNGFMRSFAEVAKIPAPQRRPAAVQELLERISTLFYAESRQRRVVWQWKIEQALEPILMDATQMEQAFVNICKNALEAIGESGVITIRMGKRGLRSFVAIEDSGVGMPPEAQAQIFTPFFSSKSGGQGLGLTVVHEILSKHQFEFALESKSGQPTIFTILF
ncbi:MAG: sensor histidine kinase [bacterium]